MPARLVPHPASVPIPLNGTLERIHDDANTIVSALARSSPAIYRFRDSLAQLSLPSRADDAPRLRPVTQPRLRDAISSCLRFETPKVDKKTGETRMVPYAPSRDMLAVLAERVDDDVEGFANPIPRTSGVVAWPILAADGTVFDRRGQMEPASGLICGAHPSVCGGSTQPDPSAQNPAKALAYLKGLLAEFPFDKPEHHSAALSALISPVVKHLCGNVPIHCIGATQERSGKGFLVEIASRIATGAPVRSIGANKEGKDVNVAELEKNIVSNVLAGTRMLSIDNVNGEFYSNLLCSMTVQQEMSIRALGQSVSTSIGQDSFPAFYATGNGIDLTNDLRKRTVFIQLNPRMEDASQRRFSADPLEMASRDRRHYLKAIFLVVSSYARERAAERGIDLPPLASFSGWSRLVREALVWLGEPDPLASQTPSVQADTNLARMKGLTTLGLHYMGPSKLFSVGELVAAIDAGGDRDHIESLETVLVVRGSRAPRSMSVFIEKNGARVLGGHWWKVDKTCHPFRFMILPQ